MFKEGWVRQLLIGIAGCVLFAAMPRCAAMAEPEPGAEKKQGFGGPASVQGELKERAEVTEPAFQFSAIDEFLQPWFDMKADINDQFGLLLGVHYTATYQGATNTLPGGEDNAASGIFRVLGDWTLIDRGGKNEGALDFSFDHRHRLGTDIAPADLGFEVGYLGIPATLFSDARWVLVDLNWQQYLNNGQTGLIVGRYDPNDYLDVLGYSNPWATFQNLAILFNTSIALPDNSWGAGAGHWINDQWYAVATINDANGVVTEVEGFSGGAEFYTSAEIGWSLTRNQRYTHNVHITGWHADKRDDAGVPESWGFALAANWTLENGIKRGGTLMSFARAGWSDGTAPLANASVTLGLLYSMPNSSDQVGIAGDWSDLPDDALDDQYTAELFYRFQLAQNLAVTPHVQLLLDPALNPTDDQIWIGGARMRLTF
jgi:porin